MVKSVAVLAVVGLYLGLMGSGEALAADFSTASTLPHTIIINRMGEVNGFGFGADVCPIGCTLPMPPVGSNDPPPFDAPDSPCVLDPKLDTRLQRGPTGGGSDDLSRIGGQCGGDSARDLRQWADRGFASDVAVYL